MVEIGYGDWKIGISIEEIVHTLTTWSAKREPHIKYDCDFHTRFYANEERWVRSAKSHVVAPYTILCDYRSLGRLKSWGCAQIAGTYAFPMELHAHKLAMIEKFKREGKFSKGNQACPRVTEVQIGPGGVPNITLQKAEYADQIGSNLTPDQLFSTNIQGFHTVREWDAAHAIASNRLPTFAASRLANTIGVAIGITARDKHGKVKVLSRKRSKTVAVYDKQWHVPFSFALRWNENLKSGQAYDLKEVIALDFMHEFGQELRMLNPEDFEQPRPLALCRDLVRAGKPQVFFEMTAKIAFEELAAKLGPDGSEYRGPARELDVEQDEVSPELIAFAMLAGSL